MDKDSEVQTHLRAFARSPSRKVEKDCDVARGRVEENRTLRSYPSLLLHNRKLRTTRCMAERVNNKLSSVLAGTPIKKNLKKGLVRRSPL